MTLAVMTTGLHPSGEGAAWATGHTAGRSEIPRELAQQVPEEASPQHTGCPGEDSRTSPITKKHKIPTAVGPSTLMVPVTQVKDSKSLLKATRTIIGKTRGVNWASQGVSGPGLAPHGQRLRRRARSQETLQRHLRLRCRGTCKRLKQFSKNI